MNVIYPWILFHWTPHISRTSQPLPRAPYLVMGSCSFPGTLVGAPQGSHRDVDCRLTWFVLYSLSIWIPHCPQQDEMIVGHKYLMQKVGASVISSFHCITTFRIIKKMAIIFHFNILNQNSCVLKLTVVLQKDKVPIDSVVLVIVWYWKGVKPLLELNQWYSSSLLHMFHQNSGNVTVCHGISVPCLSK